MKQKNMIELARILDQYTDEEIMEARVLTKGLEIIKDRLISSMGGWNTPEFDVIKGLERKIVEKMVHSLYSHGLINLNGVDFNYQLTQQSRGK